MPATILESRRIKPQENPLMVLEIKKLEAPLGALVYGWQPGEVLSRVDQRSIREGLYKHQVLVFRGHKQPTDAELVRFAAHFGILIKGSEWFGDIDHLPEILRVNNLIDEDGVPEGTGASSSLEWHADYSYVATVGKESFLEAVELPVNNNPQTCFCSQSDAFERLPSAMKKMLRPLRAYHSITRQKSQKGDTPITADINGEYNVRDDFKAKRERNRQLGVNAPEIPEAEHPVVIRHPDTDREILYVSKGITRQILDLPKDESNALLKELAAHSTAADYVYSHQWLVGDMVVFDTLGTLHRRDAWDPTERRVMRQLSSLWTPPVESVVV